jgi:hypothetical protein
MLTVRQLFGHHFCIGRVEYHRFSHGILIGHLGNLLPLLASGNIRNLHSGVKRAACYTPAPPCAS